MKKDILFFKVRGADGLGLELTNTKDKDGVTVYSFKLSWTEENAKADSTLSIDWETARTIIPATDSAFSTSECTSVTAQFTRICLCGTRMKRPKWRQYR